MPEGFHAVIVLFKKDDLQEPSRLANLGIPVMEKLEILKLVAETAEKESNRSWTRYAVMLYASIGLLAVLLLTVKTGISWINAVPAVIGVIVSIAWLKTNAISGSYAKRWQADMEKVVESDKTLQEWVRATNLPGIRRPFTSKTTGFYFNLLPNAFLGIWSFILLAVVFSGLWRTSPEPVTADTLRGGQVYVDEHAGSRIAEERGGKSLPDKAIPPDSPGVDVAKESQGHGEALKQRSDSQVIATETRETPKRSAREIRAEQVRMSGSKKGETSKLRIAPEENTPF